jgi:hypothetical protein
MSVAVYCIIRAGRYAAFVFCFFFFSVASISETADLELSGWEESDGLGKWGLRLEVIVCSALRRLDVPCLACPGLP